jgi:hypothetical protein
MESIRSLGLFILITIPSIFVELQDHWIQAREPVLDGVTFCVKFLGSALIEKTGASDAAEATKTVIQMVI